MSVLACPMKRQATCPSGQSGRASPCTVQAILAVETNTVTALTADNICHLWTTMEYRPGVWTALVQLSGVPSGIVMGKRNSSSAFAWVIFATSSAGTPSNRVLKAACVVGNGVSACG